MALRRFTSQLVGIMSTSDSVRLPLDDELEAADVPVSREMRGSVKAYRRQVVISTGKADWVREVTDEAGSLAAYLQEANKKLLKQKARSPSSTPPHLHSDLDSVNGSRSSTPGIYRSEDSNKLSILNGSHHSVDDDGDLKTVLVFPDYKVVTRVEESLAGAEELWRDALDPGLGKSGRAGATKFKTWTLPYSCVILLCSHKRRDKRCHISAPKLEAGQCMQFIRGLLILKHDPAFSNALEQEGWDVHTQLEDPDHYPDSSLEELEETAPEERDEVILDRLKAIPSDGVRKALILKNSHIGGHRYAGNCIIYTPQGSGIWYGRVSPHEVEQIVRATLIEGRILPALLRGGFNVTRTNCRKNLIDW